MDKNKVILMISAYMIQNVIKTSTREDPINAHLIRTLEIIGLRHIAKINILRINPTPIATPAKEINGILLAEYLKPSRIMDDIQLLL